MEGWSYRNECEWKEGQFYAQGFLKGFTLDDSLKE